jgi:ParB family chromosome partitioning protein
MDVRDIEIGLIDVGGHEQRFDYEGDEMEELVGSVRRDGILEPIIVRAVGERFVVVNGHRRREAAIRAGLSVVPCHVQAGDLDLSRRTAFITNLFRKDPSPVEMAVAIGREVGSGEESVEGLAKGLGRSVDWVRRQVAMLQWPEDVLQLVHAGKVSVAAAANLACVTDDSYRAFLLEHASSGGATARTTASWLQAWEGSLPAAVAVIQPPVDGEPHAPPMMPQAPCLCCGGVHRTDELSHVPLCAPCIQRVRHLGAGGR